MAFKTQWHRHPGVRGAEELTLGERAADRMRIAAKRADQIASEIAVHTETNTDDIKTLLEQNTRLTEAIEALTRDVHAKVIGSIPDVDAPPVDAGVTGGLLK